MLRNIGKNENIVGNVASLYYQPADAKGGYVYHEIRNHVDLRVNEHQDKSNLETIGEVSYSNAVAVCMGDDNDFVSSIDKTL
jgi:hypothetical protein